MVIKHYLQGIKQSVAKMILSYNPLWLRIGLEVSANSVFYYILVTYIVKGYKTAMGRTLVGEIQPTGLYFMTFAP